MRVKGETARVSTCCQFCDSMSALLVLVFLYGITEKGVVRLGAEAAGAVPPALLIIAAFYLYPYKNDYRSRPKTQWNYEEPSVKILFSPEGWRPAP